MFVSVLLRLSEQHAKAQREEITCLECIVCACVPKCMNNSLLIDLCLRASCSLNEGSLFIFTGNPSYQNMCMVQRN